MNKTFGHVSSLKHAINLFRNWGRWQVFFLLFSIIGIAFMNALKHLRKKYHYEGKSKTNANYVLVAVAVI
jgi:hypothetical protein